jgi:uncharacterized membrane protein
MSGQVTSTARRPLHAALTDIPIGAVLIATVLDVVSAASSGHSLAHETYRAATFTLMIGETGLFLAVAAGLLDARRFTTRGTRQRRSVKVHAWVMAIVGVLGIVDLVLRRNRYGDAAHTPGIVLVVTLLALGIALAGAALGGKLVFRAGIGVAAAAPRQSGAAPAPSAADTNV